MSEIVPRWEWRVFGDDLGAAEAVLMRLAPGAVQESDELYVLSRDSDSAVKVRGGLMDVKHLLDVDGAGLEQWTPVMKRSFPLSAADLRTVLAELAVAPPPLGRAAYELAELSDEVIRPNEALHAVRVHKRRAHFTIGGCMAELTDVRTAAGATRTIVVESEDASLVLAAVRSLGLETRANINMPRGLKALAGIGTRRFAAIDVGTSSVKLHVGARRADGSWSTIADRAEVTRLGEGLEATGALASRPIERTIAAIGGMMDEATERGAEEVAAVGTAGLRSAANRADFLAAVEARCGVRIEIISAEEEGRLAYLGATSALSIGRESIVVFDTGGGSSQFTFGHGDAVDERFSVPLGAVRLTERYGLADAVSEARLDAALADIAATLVRLDGRPRADALVGMGGAVTNLAAVMHGLATYDPDIVQGSVLDRAEVDRQIELYRTRGADQRRAVIGLQSNRAEVILAGACVVRTVMTMLGHDSLVVSDRALRHGLIVDRFPLDRRPG